MLLATGQVLEIGGGAGVNFVHYRTTNVEKIYALEPNKGMRRHAQEQRRQSRLDAEFIDLRGERIPLADASIDTVVSTFTLCTIPGVVEAIRVIFFEHGLSPDVSVQRWQKVGAAILKELNGPLQTMPLSDSAVNRNAYALAGLRIAVGCLFLIFGQYKVFGTQFTLHGGFQFWINRFLQEGTAYPFMVPVLQRFVLPHATIIAFLVAYSEFAIGLALVFGILVRAASASGFVYMVTLLLSSNYPGAHVPLWQYFGASLEHSVLALCFLTFILGRSDEVLSIKEFLPTRAR